MAKEGASTDTGVMLLGSLQLDVQTLQKHREEDKQEFVNFSTSVQNNFVSIQNNFDSIQANFEKLFAKTKLDPVEQTSSTPDTPPNINDLSAKSVKNANQQQAAVGQGTLHDLTGKELNLDGTTKVPYRHPHFGRVTTVIPAIAARNEVQENGAQPLQQQEVHAQIAQGEEPHDLQKRGNNNTARLRNLGQ